MKGVHKKCLTDAAGRFSKKMTYPEFIEQKWVAQGVKKHCQEPTWGPKCEASTLVSLFRQD